MNPKELRYTEEHEWAFQDGDVVTIGITDHAANELGEIVFVELPKVGSEIAQMGEFGSVESVKTLSSLFLPISGEIVEINNQVIEEPGLVNESPFEDGWLVKVKMADENELDDLLSSDEYEQFLNEE